MHYVLFKILGPSTVIAGALLLLTSSGRAATPTDVAVKVTGTSFKVGALGRYTLTVANRGNQPTDDPVHVMVTLPAGLTFMSQQGSAWTCAASGQAVDCVTDRSLAAGRTSTFRLWVRACDAAFPLVFTSFQVVYAADTKSGNNVASRSTVIRAGHCVQGTVTPTRGSGTPPATKTPVPAGTRTPTPIPSGDDAPVVTSFTCNGGAACSVATDQSFQLLFSFTDADANAISWSIMGRRDDGFTKQLGRGNLGAGTASATIPIQFPAFTCSFSHCRQEVWTFTLTVSDTSGLTSAPVSVTITVLAS
ncbi:MAG TPA: hypothetical protein VMW56_00620 [Candidatus Margulisiibacteriota bacterium]|nr:hypothetical protein [Candidatus Margulisiibacteriota bacterium]